MQTLPASANHPRSPTAHIALCIALFAEENIMAPLIWKDPVYNGVFPGNIIKCGYLGCFLFSEVYKVSLEGVYI